MGVTTGLFYNPFVSVDSSYNPIFDHYFFLPALLNIRVSLLIAFVEIYGGVESNLFSGFKIYNFDEATVYGSTVKYRDLLNTNLELAYLLFECKMALIIAILL